MLKTLYEHAMTFNEFMSLENAKYKESMEKFSNIDEIDKEVEANIMKIRKNIKILVFAEILCPDCVINVSALEKMSLLNPMIEFMIVSRAGNEDTMKVYGDKDKLYVPTFIIMDEDYNVIGNFIERPTLIKELSNENDQVKRILMMKNYRKGQYIDETIRDILNLI